jgi:hypothetical protein
MLNAVNKNLSYNKKSNSDIRLQMLLIVLLCSICTQYEEMKATRNKVEHKLLTHTKRTFFFIFRLN